MNYYESPLDIHEFWMAWKYLQRNNTPESSYHLQPICSGIDFFTLVTSCRQGSADFWVCGNSPMHSSRLRIQKMSPEARLSPAFFSG